MTFYSRKLRHLIKEKRLIKGITQKQLGKRVGYTRSAFANIENGYRPMNERLYRKLDKILNLHPSLYH